jgi:hypothetical protein
MFIWDCLSSDTDTGEKLARMVGGTGGWWPTHQVNSPPNCANGRPSKGDVKYIPLSFFYTRNPGAALPLIALQYHEVKINIQWNDIKFIAGNFTDKNSFPRDPIQAAVYIDYVYLDTEERRRMAQNSHEYLIEQTQYNEDKGITSANNRIDLTFNHPVKELVWVVQPSEYTDCNLAAAPGDYQSSRLRPFTYDWDAVYEQWIQINGQDRLDRRYGDYFNRVQPYQHHTGSANPVVTRSGQNPDGQEGRVAQELQNPGMYMYSFALRPEEHQPSGTCNFSRIDTATIVLNIAGYDTNNYVDDSIEISPERPWDVRVYAVNYNILRVMSGMGGLAYSN